MELQEAQRMVADRERELTEAHTRAITELTTRAETAERDRDTANTELRRLQEAAILREARDTVAEALRPVTTLPEITKTRLAETVSFNPPIKDGQLDKTVLATNLEEAVKNEVQYLAAATGSGRPFNLGGGNGGNQGDPATQRTALEEAFRDLGLGEDEAKGAAVGRT